MAVHAERSIAAAEVPVEAVGISAGDGRNLGAGRGDVAPSAVTYGSVFGAEFLYLENLDFSDATGARCTEGRALMP